MRSARRPSLLLLPLLAVLLAVAGCAGSGGDDSGGAGAADQVADAPAETAPGRSEAYGEQDAELSMADRAVDSFEDAATTSPAGPDSTARKIIAKGNVSLHSGDVARTAADVTRIADERGGEVSERETTTDKDGEVSTARLLLRIPVAVFDETFRDLEGVAELISSSTGKEDVTTKVIDTRVRIRAQRRSLLRVEALFDRAQSISDIIRIESQVSRRQADLESLERRLDYLTDQTSMSTISVNISLPPKEKGEPKEEPERTGFLAGLDDGWKALKSFGTDVATLTGQVLPFLGLLLLIGIPLWVVVRRLGRRRGDTAAAPANQ